MKGAFLTVAKRISELGEATRFGPNWPGKGVWLKPKRNPMPAPRFQTQW